MQNEPEDFSEAAGPFQKQTAITTPATGLVTGSAQIKAADRIIPGYFAYPEKQKDAPLLLVLSEAFGLHEHIRDVTRRFANEGFFAVAPDLVVRQGDPNTFADIPSLVRDLLLTIPDEQVLSDLDATLHWALQQGADRRRAGITGFCWGGRWTWLYAAHQKLHAAVAWYGILNGRESGVFAPALDRHPTHPLDVVHRLLTPVLGLYGGQDEAIHVRTIEQMREALRSGSSAARSSEIEVFAEAGHAFFADYRESYRREASVEAWHQCVTFLKRDGENRMLR